MEVSNIYITTFIQSIEVHREKLAEALATSSGAKEIAAMLDLSLDAVKNIGHTAFQDITDSQKLEEELSIADLKKNLSNYFVCFDWVSCACPCFLQDFPGVHNVSDWFSPYDLYKTA